MFADVLIANRGEIACRIIATARRMGLRALVAHTPADRGARFTRLADRAIEIGEGANGYLDIDALVGAAVEAKAQCLHPGYGFLSENADFAEACARAGVVFVGPPPSAMRAMGLKDAAKALMVEAGAPVVPGYHGDNQSAKFLQEQADEIGYPVLIKAVAGGGGRGMRRVDARADFVMALESAAREAKAAFGDYRVLIEKYIVAPRHIEVQAFGDRFGNVVHLYERDCSLQRRHQKIVEETPAPGLPEETRAAMCAAAVAAAKAVGYVGAGTVEFIVDAARGLGPDCFYFLEMNTRLQVEHPVTEALLGLDLVEWQFRVAAGEPLPLRQQDLAPRGAAIEARLNAEDPERGFLPSPGLVRALGLDEAEVRVDSGVEAGDSVSPFYDSMIAKVIAHGATREQALRRLEQALAQAVVIGPKTNLAFLQTLLASPEVAAGVYDTGFIDANLQRLGAAPREPDAHAALAGAEALFRKSLPAPSAPADPWSIADSFELAGVRRTPFEARVEGERTALVAIARAGALTFAFKDGRPAPAGGPVTLHETEDGVLVLHQGRQTRVALVDPLEGPAVGARGPSGEIAAPMHGRLAALFVEEGQTVEAGARLAVVEAMKMEHALIAPAAGTVRGLTAKAGDSVEQGAVILRVEA